MIYTKILLPVGGADKHGRAEKALAHTLPLAQGEIIILHVIAPLSKVVGGEAHAELLRSATADALTYLAPVTAMLEKEGRQSRVRVVEGTPADTIIKVAHEEECDLIVMFTDGRDELQDMILGSITERVLRETDIPLLAVRR